MKVKATKSFSGLVTMAKGSVRELPEGPILSDLLSCGYVECIERDKSEPKLEETEPVKTEEIVDEEPDVSAEPPVTEEPKKKPAKKRSEKG